MDARLIQHVTTKHQKKNVPVLRAGDVIRVHEKVKEGSKERIQVFEGIVIRVRGGVGMDATFTVRRTGGGVGIERTFPLHLPAITKVEKIRELRLRQSRPYYLRTLTAKQLKRKATAELSEYVVFEEAAAQEEEEAIKAAQEAEAKAREQAEKQQEAEAEAKVAEAKAKHDQETAKQ